MRNSSVDATISRCKNLLEYMVEALKEVFIGGVATITVLAHIVSRCPIVFVILLLIIKVIVQYG